MTTAKRKQRGITFIGVFLVGLALCWQLSTLRAKASASDAGRTPLVLRGHKGFVTSIAYSPDGHSLASSSDDHTVRIWDLASGKTEHVLSCPDEVYAVTYSPNGRWIASSGYDSHVLLWDAHNGKLVRTIGGFQDWSVAIAFSPDSQRLVAGIQNGAILIWDLPSGKLLQTLKQPILVTAIAISPNGRYLATAAKDIYLWDLQAGKIVRTLKGHSNLISALAFSPDGSLLASASWDKTARIWNVETGQSLHILEQVGKVTYATGYGSQSRKMKLPIDAVAFSPDGKLFATGGADHLTRLWNVASGTFVQSLESPTMAVTSVALSPDGKYLASSSLDRTIWIWSLNQTLNGPAETGAKTPHNNP